MKSLPLRLAPAAFLLMILATQNCAPAEEVPTGIPATVVSGAQLVSVYHDDRFFEGPAWDPKAGRLYFTAFGNVNGPDNQQILRLDEPGKVTVWLDRTEGVNGMYLANDGRLLGAQAYGHRIMSYAIGDSGPADTNVLLHDTKLHQPNDVAQSPNGDIYFTDPDFQKGETSAVYVITAKGEVKKIIEDMRIPNGLKVSNDGRTLYVADDGPMNWRKYSIQSDGTVGPGQLFFDPPVPTEKRTHPDGMSIDEHGRLYLSGSGGVWVVDKFGVSLGLIPVPELIAADGKTRRPGFCSNVTFGGQDGKTLYLTCQDHVYSLPMTVRGGQFVRKNK
ncbi:MAG: SMP-30/gluconolactonase/LRE family protein [Deltaproteobacteria bacterium]